MVKVFSPQEMAECDKMAIERGASQCELVQRAAEAVAGVIMTLKAANGKILIVSGLGNNGADGMAAAGILESHGYDCYLYIVGELNDASKSFLPMVKNIVCDLSGEYDIIVDGIFGTGLSRNVCGNEKIIIDRLNEMLGYKVAIDLPSGLCGNSGLTYGTCFNADLTVTFEGYKYGHLLGDGRDMCGEVKICDIGIDNIFENIGRINEGEELKNLFAPRKVNSHKGTYKRVAVASGSKKFFGAGELSLGALTALVCGSGYAYHVCDDDVLPLYAGGDPEVITASFDDKLEVDCLAMGMGLTTSERAKNYVIKCLKEYSMPIILDADAINIVAMEGLELLKTCKAKLILTPHIGEFARLINESVQNLLRDPVKKAKQFALEYGVILVLKGATTIITDGVRLYFNVTGSPALAKGGSGDVLSGVMAALVSRCGDLLGGALAATYLFGKAGEFAAKKHSEHCVLARDVIYELKNVIKCIN